MSDRFFCEKEMLLSGDNTMKMCKKLSNLFLFVSVLYWLTLNYGIGISCDEVSQVLQWRQFCLRGIIVGLVLLLFTFVISPKSIVNVIELSIITLCIIEGVYSMLQLYGVLPSLHNIFKVTGSFYNPGPLGGMLVVAIPILLNKIFNLESKHIKYLFGFLLVFIVISLPQTFSRTAWISAVVSAVYVMYCNGKITPLIAKLKIRPRYILILLTLSVVFGAFFLWQFKRESALGRLFLWKVSILAILEAPLFGNGNFVKAFSTAQEDYFANCDASESEKLAAGSPDYAFNEYLQIGVEYGLPILFLVLAFLGVIIIKSYREKTFGLSGSLLSVMVFAFASYPLHLPTFVAVVSVVIFGILINDAYTMRQQLIVAIIPLIILLFSILSLSNFKQKSTAMEKWKQMSILYRNKCYGDVVSKYSAIYDAMNWNPRFAYEYGHSLYKSKQFDAAIPVLERVVCLSTDPMPLNVLGECHQALHHYETAEKYYHRATLRIPSRLYPHYLLYFLYCEEGFSNDSLRREKYSKVMTMKIKTESSATRDLRKEVEDNENSITQ